MNNLKEEMGIYMIRFKSTGQMYIGQTNNLKRRLNEHSMHLKLGNDYHLIQDCYNDLGDNDVEYKILEIVDSLDNLNDREKYYIQFYKEKDPSKLLNQNIGGGVKRDWTKDQKDIMRTKLSKSWFDKTEDQRLKVINKRKEVYNARTDKEKQERNKKISESTKEMWNNRSKEERELVKEKVKESLANMTNEENESRWKHFDNTIKNRTKEEKTKVSESARNNANIYWQTATPEQKAERARKIGEASRKRHEAARLKKLQEQQLQGNKLF